MFPHHQDREFVQTIVVQQCHMARVTQPAEVEQGTGIGVVKVRPHLIRIRVRSQTVEGETPAAGPIKCGEGGLQMLLPFGITVPKPDVEDTAGNTVIGRFERFASNRKMSIRTAGVAVLRSANHIAGDVAAIVDEFLAA